MTRAFRPRDGPSVEDHQGPWTAEEPLSELSLFSDWDPMASMVDSLRIHLFEYGTIPVWNYQFCGGRPDLSVPSNWAYTWPSLFAYVFSGNYAIVVAWIVLTTIGFLAMRTLLRDWTGSSLGAAVGACVYAFNGVLVQAFTHGQVSFAFYHLIPLLMLVFDRTFRRGLLGQENQRLLLLTTFVSFLLITAGLPHTLMYLYPAFMLFVAWRVFEAARAFGWRRALATTRPAIVAHLLGLALGAYKLWPVIRWQLEFPREGVDFAATALLKIVKITLVWPAPGTYPFAYRPYMGPMPWLLGGLAVLWLIWHSLTRARQAGEPSWSGVGYFGLAVLLAGIVLTLGNDHPLSPAYLFRHLPLLRGIRGFLRYEILVAMGLCILVALSFAILGARWGSGRVGRWALVGVAFATAAPILAQASFRAWNIPYLPKSEIRSLYSGLTPTTAPQLVFKHNRGRYRERTFSPDHESTLLSRGHWIGNCRKDLKLPPLRYATQRGFSVPISQPPPGRVARVTRNSLTLVYSVDQLGRILLGLPVMEMFEFDAPVLRAGDGGVSFLGSDLHDSRLTITARYPGPRAGALASAAALMATVLFYALRLRGRGR